MRILLLSVGLWLMTAGGVLAFSSVAVEPVAPYEPYFVSEPYHPLRVYLGDLDGFPDMYELASPEPFSLVLDVATVVPDHTNAAKLAVIIVSVTETDVDEVARLPYEVEAWQSARQAATGLTLLTGPQYEAELPAGRYRIEISTPDNVGQYVLTLGSESSGAGYFASLGSIARTYDFVGVSKWGMIRSPYLQVPLIVLLVGLLLGVSWRYRKYIVS